MPVILLDITFLLCGVCVYLYIYMYASVLDHARSEANLQESVISFYRVGPRD